ncbi:SDR family oxidoreductase [Humibacter ginsengisoli]
MRVFITGASGHIGSLVTAELIENGHEVLGLARSDASAQRITELGGEPVLGTIDDTDRLAELAATSDGVVNLAFKHDAGDFAAAAASDRALIEAIGRALEGSGKPFLAASGTMMLAGSTSPGDVGTESTPIEVARAQNPRAISEQQLLGLSDRGIRSAALRFAPTVHGPSDLHGFIPALIRFARENGYAAYVGDGENRWPAVHNIDAAHLIVLGLERAPGGMPLHAVADEGIPFRRIAEAIGRGAGVPVRSISPEEAAGTMGLIGTVAAIDNPTSSTETREVLGWAPTHPGLLEDLAASFYFNR